VTGADLLAIQLTLECIGMDKDGLLVRIPGPYPDGIPRFYVAEFSGGRAMYCSRDMPPTIRPALLALPFERARDDYRAVCSLLDQHASCDGVWAGASYTFPGDFPSPDDDAVVRLDASDRALIERFDPELLAFPPPVYALLVDGAIVAACVSSRENAQAGEAWVQTHPAYRRRGYGRRATAAWGAGLVRQGKIAYYSHRVDNAASAAIARGLGLAHYLSDVGYM
jgi:hypothetical protein